MESKINLLHNHPDLETTTTINNPHDMMQIPVF
jgi:hypothetical protein